MRIATRRCSVRSCAARRASGAARFCSTPARPWADRPGETRLAEPRPERSAPGSGRAGGRLRARWRRLRFGAHRSRELRGIARRPGRRAPRLRPAGPAEGLPRHAVPDLRVAGARGGRGAPHRRRLDPAPTLGAARARPGARPHRPPRGPLRGGALRRAGRRAGSARDQRAKLEDAGGEARDVPRPGSARARQRAAPRRERRPHRGRCAPVLRPGRRRAPRGRGALRRQRPRLGHARAGAGVSGMRIKLCGVRTARDAELCGRAGADEVGVVFAPRSRRCVTVKTAREIRAALPQDARLVGVFQDVDLADALRVVAEVGLSAVQLHGTLPAPAGTLPLYAAVQVDGEPALSRLAALRGFRRGRFGAYGGRFVPETLIPALDELESAWRAARADAAYREELSALLQDYAGRPTPLSDAPRLAQALGVRARLLLKREDLLHTGAHKLNNTLGQALLARRMGKKRVIAEAGAGQHGVATATVCALLGLDCIVYMGVEDVERQAPNVSRMGLLGAEVRPVEAGSRTLKDAMNEAIRDWVTNVRTTYYCIGSAAGPHPYPLLVRELQSIIGEEIAAQCAERLGRAPDAVVACVGGGSNAIGAFHRFVPDRRVRLFGVEAAGLGLDSGKHGASLSRRRRGVLP